MKKRILKLLTVSMASAMMIMPTGVFAAEDAGETAVVEMAESPTTDAVGEESDTRIGWPIYICNANNVNVRSGPGSSYSSLGTLAKGTEVRVRSTNNGWCKIKFGNQIGYVYSKYLTKKNKEFICNCLWHYVYNERGSYNVL